MEVSLANLFLTGGTLLQANYQHNKTLETEELLFKEELAHMEEEHQKVLVLRTISKQVFLKPGFIITILYLSSYFPSY